MKNAKGLVFLLALGTSLNASCAREIKLGGDRPATLYFPDNYHASQPVPLILFLHGYDASGPIVDERFNVVADSNKLGYLALLPDGTPDKEGKNFWNATPECCDDFASARDDVTYLVNLVAEARAKSSVRDVYIFGHSNGGFMANRMACERPDLFKGIVSIAGGFFRDPSLCKNPAPISYLQIHGTGDLTVPYDGGDKFPTPHETVNAWWGIDRCTGSVNEKGVKNLVTLTIIDVPEGNETDALSFTGCASATKVGLWTVNGGTHNMSYTDVIGQAVDFFAP